MPSKSPAMKKTMAAIAHGWKPPPGSSVADISKSVATEFFKADQAKAKREGRDKGGKEK
jgi:hypothetical protein